MTPLALELRGFTCFREPAHLELAGLTLFGITGPTGAGKSTLLDAITYALYGQTARLGKQNLDVLISPGETQMSVTLDFAAASGTYRVVRTADRKPSGKVERNTRILELQAGAQWRQLPESEKLREADDKIERLVGLDYEGFTRSVLLPQGAFDEFLRGDTAKRRKLLVSLLNLEKVEAMQKEAGRRAREADAKAKHLTVRLEQDYGGVTPEARRDLGRRLAEVQAEAARVSARERALAAELEALKEVRDLLDELADVERELGELARLASEMGAGRERLAAARRAAPVQPLLDQEARARARLTALRGGVAEAEQRRAAAEGRVAAAGDDAAAAEARVKARLPDLEASLQSVVAARPRFAQLERHGGRLADAAKADPNVTYTDDAWESVQARTARLPELKRLHQERARAARALSDAARALEGAVKVRGQTAATLADVKAQGLAAKARKDEADRRYEEAVTRDRASALRHHLHEGDSCPVCLQPVARVPPAETDDLDARRAERDAAAEALEALRNRYQALSADAKAAEAREEAQRAAQEEAAAALRRAEAALREVGEADPAEVERRLTVERTGLLAALARDIAAQTGGREPQTAEAALKREKEGLEQAHRRADQALLEARSALEQARALLLERGEQLGAAERDLEDVQAAAAAAVLSAGFPSAEAARAAVLPEREQQALEAAIRSFESRREAAGRREVSLRAKLAGRTLPPGRFEALNAEREEVAAQAKALQEEAGSLRRAHEDMGAKLERAAALRAERDAAVRTHDTYHTLSQDLRGNELQEFLLGQVQSKLARHASHTLQAVTGGRYDLRLIEGEYQVLDAWNENEVRNAKTLSGGETFIASLALALALSDSISGRALGALFLDEGFGTLDADTLEAVASVLEALTREGRMVGVITHVRSLSERLPARLSVIKGPQGSTVSWDAP